MAETTVIDGVDYGPLAVLVGNWSGDKGVDLAPEPDGEEQTPYYETILFEAIGSVTNAEQQTLAVLRYHQIVTRKSDNQVFHNETGYWSWDAASNDVFKTFSIPRAVAVMAAGSVAADGAIEVKAGSEGIVQQPFMAEKASTTGYQHRVAVVDGQLSYQQTTSLAIYDRDFEHTDENSLQRD